MLQDNDGIKFNNIDLRTKYSHKWNMFKATMKHIKNSIFTDIIQMLIVQLQEKVHSTIK